MTQEVTLAGTSTRISEDGAVRVGVFAKRRYRIGDLGIVSVDDNTPELVTGPVLANDGWLEHDTETAIQRPLTDIYIDGYAQSGRASRGFVCSAQIGHWRREISVIGDREAVIDTNAAVTFSSVRPIERVKLGWCNAYGGVDRASLDRYGDKLLDFASLTGIAVHATNTRFAYPRNPFGKGYVVDANANTGTAITLPNLESPCSLLTQDSLVIGSDSRWPLGPLPASTALLGYDMFPRLCWLGMLAPRFDERLCEPGAVPEVMFHGLNPDALLKRPLADRRFDPLATQSSAIGMRASGVKPGDRVELVHMHPTHPVWRWELPREKPRLGVMLSGYKPQEVEATIRSIFIEPEEHRVTLVWGGDFEHPYVVSPSEQQDIKHGVVWRRY